MENRKMKRVQCLYRVSTIGQVDHNDIPVQREACRKYASLHDDWVIENEVLEMGVSGYKNKADQRQGVVALREAALAKRFDVLLVFMFDRIGRRTDDTPVVMQWFVNHGIEIWSVNEGQRKYDTPEDELIGWLSTWQASGESRKTSLRVKASKAAMSARGYYTGGFVPYGYDALRQGRVNKKDQPVRDLVINPEEAEIVQFIFHAIVKLGFGSYVVANALNDRHILTKRGTSLWRATSIRVILRNPIYTGRMRTPDGLTEPFEQYRIIDDATFQEANEKLRSRDPFHRDETEAAARVPAEERGLLAGIIFCGHCGARMAFNLYRQKRTLADGTIRVYERQVYRCYKRLYHHEGCPGRSCYKCAIIEGYVLTIVRRFLLTIRKMPSETVIQNAMNAENSLLMQAFQQSKKALEKAKLEMSRLQEKAIKVLTGKSTYSSQIINQLLPLQEEKLAKAQEKFDHYSQEIAEEKKREQSLHAKIEQFITWGDIFDSASYAEKRQIIAAIVRRVIVHDEQHIDVELRFTMQQYLNDDHVTDIH